MSEKQLQLMKALNHYLEQLKAEYEDTPDNLLAAKIHIWGKVEALEFVIEHFGDLKELDNGLRTATERLYKQKERMSEFASPRLNSEGWIEALLEAKNLIEQILSQ